MHWVLDTELFHGPPLSLWMKCLQDWIKLQFIALRTSDSELHYWTVFYFCPAIFITKRRYVWAQPKCKGLCRDRPAHRLCLQLVHFAYSPAAPPCARTATATINPPWEERRGEAKRGEECLSVLWEGQRRPHMYLHVPYELNTFRCLSTERCVFPLRLWPYWVLSHRFVWHCVCPKNRGTPTPPHPTRVVQPCGGVQTHMFCDLLQQEKLKWNTHLCIGFIKRDWLHMLLDLFHVAACVCVCVCVCVY